MTKTKRKQLKTALALALVLGFVCQNFSSAKLLTTQKGDTEVNGKIVKEEEGKLEGDKKPIYYELIHETLRPDANEYYLSTIYGTAEHPRALIKRSQNLRAGDLYTSNVEYGLGDEIAEGLKIVEINFRHREVIVQDIKTNTFYGLGLSYGKAVSRLIRKPNYELPESLKKAEEVKEKASEPASTEEAKEESSDS